MKTEVFNDKVMRQKIMFEVLAERERQNEKWGVQNHTVVEWQSILMEEVGEVAKEATDYYFGYPYLNGVGEMQPIEENDVVQYIRLRDYRKELIQVAAVAVQMIECLDRAMESKEVNRPELMTAKQVRNLIK